MRISDWSSDVCSSDLSLRMAPGQPAQFAGEPGVVVGVELQLRQRVAPVRVEAGGDQQQLWPEGVDRRQQAVFPGCPEAAAAGARWQRGVEDVAGAALVPVPGVRVQRHLVRAQVLHARFVFEDRRSEEHTSELQSLMRISYAV